MKTTLRELYRGPLTVWVEDRVTHAVLTDVWGDPQINVLVGDGKAGVTHMVNASPPGLHVYGVVDRDFEDDNAAKWTSPGCRVLRLPAHEIENLLLDFDVLASLSGSEPAARIRKLAHDHAQKMRFWMICCRVLWDMQRDLGKGFPERPPNPTGLQSLDEVKRYLENSAYWSEHGVAWQRWRQGGVRSPWIDAACNELQKHLDNDEWIRSFSGKEIFRFLRSNVSGLDRTPARPPQPSSSERDLNLAKAIARMMREVGSSPPVFVELRQVLRKKAGLT
ncbi:hypothetical protein sce8656 [Sorangium cellulosum So ce56]|uniref:DUF4435 domain-containing protein n=1 Tax=Sorangium cellulosum (strain So ce56) TaxID=448385 RepID=A9G063_SORC5|nr:hypothetical protein [Sorangium cellulosum]CAN98826.1 hypothetical protein sce8656 [Sorangium cellulosum So ce56]